MNSYVAKKNDDNRLNLRYILTIYSKISKTGYKNKYVIYAKQRFFCESTYGGK